MNTLAYILYLLLTYIITVHVGLVFYRNGRLFILGLLQGDEKLTDFINHILLVGYYLLNLGYAALMLQNWQPLTTLVAVVISVLIMTGKIMLVLGIIHFGNMGVIYLISRKHHFQPYKK